jgi:GntR family transcriptional regulator
VVETAQPAYEERIMREIDRMIDRPPYLQIADHLRSAISSGEIGPGRKLPSERRLAEAYGVDRATAHRAVLELHASGLVVAEQGRGVFVRTSPPVRWSQSWARLANEEQRGFYSDLEKAGMTPHVRTEVRRGPAPPYIAELLGVRADTEVLIRDRQMSADGLPLQLATSYYLPEVSERIPELAEQVTGPGGMLARLEEAGYKIHQRDHVGARMPRPEEARALRLGRGIPVLTALWVTYDEDDRALEVTDRRLAADRNELVYDVHR